MYTFLHFYLFVFFNDTATTEIYTLSLHDALPISSPRPGVENAPSANGRIVTANATIAKITKAGPRMLQRSRPAPSAVKLATMRARPQRPMPMASQYGRSAGPIARNVPCGRSLISQSAKAASATSVSPAAKFCSERMGPTRLVCASPDTTSDIFDSLGLGRGVNLFDV